MGIFSFFTRDDDDEDEDLLEEEEEEQEEEERAPRQPDNVTAGELFEGMRIDATTKEGEYLLTGRITARTRDTLTLGRLPGELSFKILTLNSSVKLNGYDKKLVPISLSATVEESSRTALKLKNLKVENHEESRDNFRLPYSTPITIYRQDDEQLSNPEQCQLVNISTGGCCIQSEYVHMEDEVIRISIKLEDYTPLKFLGQVVRCSNQVRGVFNYGILFAQLTEPEITSLNKMLYNLQMGIKDVHVRGDEGHW